MKQSKRNIAIAASRAAKFKQGKPKRSKYFDKVRALYDYSNGGHSDGKH